MRIRILEYLSKTCRTCGHELPIAEFYRHPKMLDGHLNNCRLCVRARVAKHREANLDSIRQYDRMRGRTEHRLAKVRNRSKQPGVKERYRAFSKGWAAANQDKRKAEQAVNNAVRDGRMTKKPCWCGQPAEGHHYDYTKPLDVIWLCNRHHSLVHRKHIDDPVTFMAEWLGVLDTRG
jgi:hypothetical protein